MRKINMIIVHCSATKAGQDIGAEEIGAWHRKQGWSEIGYHYVIRRSGKIEKGRDLEKAGAHCRGRNRHSIGICLVGGINGAGNPENNFTAEQFVSLKLLLSELREKFPQTVIHGHCDFAAKACPCFNVREFLLKELGE